MSIDEKPPFPPEPSAVPEPEPEAPRREGGWVPRPEWFAAPESEPVRAAPAPPPVEGPPPAAPDEREPPRNELDASGLLRDPAAVTAPAALPGASAATAPAVGASPALRAPPQRRGVTTALRPTEPHPLPETRPLFIVLVSLLALPAILACWFWLKAARFQPLRALALSLDAANDDPLVLYMIVELLLLLATLAAWVWRDAGRRGFGTAGRLAWAAAVGGLGTIAVWAYLAVRPDREKTG